MTTETFTIGTKATCTDGDCGTLTQVVIDPLSRAVTHLVIEPAHRSGLGRLVPLSLVDASGETLTARCTTAEFEALPAAEETHFLPGDTGGYGGFGPGQALYWPYYGLGGMGGLYGSGLAMGSVIPPVTVTDTLPAGEIGVRRGDPVHATDGEVGRVQGLVIDRQSGHVTHVLLQEGHLWGKHEVVIPIASVNSLDAGIAVTLTKAEIEALPEVDVEHPSFG